MSDDEINPPPSNEPPAPIPFAAPRRRFGRERRARPRLKKRRLLSVVAGLGLIAVVSLIFGMMMAVASDLPQLENKRQYGHEANSYLYDDQGRPIGLFAPPNHNVIDGFDGLGKNTRRAIVSVEDKRFWTDSGVDIRGVARAFVADATGGSREGASTIAQQFVKNALTEEGNRTIFEKLREATLAFHLTHEWSKKKILDEYLNSVYFGNGAYGVESAARVYFGDAPNLDYAPNDPTSTGCGDSTTEVKREKCAERLNPAQAAMLAGIVANPSAFDPIYHPHAARHRRNLVMQLMLHQHLISREQYDQNYNAPLPTSTNVEQPAEPAGAPYFTSWLRPQILSAMGLGHGTPAKVAEFRAYYGGLKIRTTIDLEMQKDAEEAITAHLPTGAGEPTASLVAIDNHTGQVRAMVGGPLVDGEQDYEKYPFNLATEGLRQPGSAFKPFTLAVALEHGYGATSVFDSRPIDIKGNPSCGQANYRPHNFDDEYEGPVSLATATAQSDNSVFTQLGLAAGVGTKRIKAMARAAGIRTPISTNCSMIIGGLKEGVSPLDMAHAYETFAEGGKRVYDPVLGAPHQGPTGIMQITCPIVKCRGKKKLVDTPHYRQVMPTAVADAVHDLLSGVVTSGTGQSAQIPGVDVVGKTGTTEDEGDAWFVGWTPQITTAVWVGFPNTVTPMLTQFNGGPVTGGTFPAEIWKTFTESALATATAENEARAARAHGGSSSASTSLSDTGTAPTLDGTSTAPPDTATETAPSGTGTAPTTGATTPATATAPSQPTTPAPTPTTPAPQPTTPAPTPTTPATPPAGTGTSGTGGAGLGGGG
jgi:penicillin-binding protein 1A